MNIRKIREDLGRVRTNCQRRNFTQALYLLISSFQELGGIRVPTDLRPEFRDAVNDVASDPLYKAATKTPLIFKPGAEKEMISALIQVYKAVANKQDEEEYETTVARKLNLDHALNDGMIFLEKGQISEADTCFTKALQYYRDEEDIFIVIGKALFEAKEYARALGHLRNGLKKYPSNQVLLRLAEACTSMRQKTVV